MHFALNVLGSALIIAAAAALSARYPVAAGFLVALPLSTMLVLPLSHIQHGDATATITFAKSILVAIPITFLFFVPLLLAERLGLSFWFAYVAGCALLPVGFVVHSALGASSRGPKSRHKWETRSSDESNRVTLTGRRMRHV
jgi:hypothetical protein